MPSTQDLPTVEQLLAASRSALLGERDRFADRRAGAIYDHVAGPTAILFAREADSDKDSFRAIYFDDADGSDLTTYVAARYSPDLVPPRALDTYGAGTCTFTRSSSAAGAGTIWQGTRVLVTGTSPAEYVVAADTAVTGTVAVVPIRASTLGIGTAIDVTAGLSLEDPLYDPLWTPASLVCADGTAFEDAPSYRARVRAALIDARNGYLPRLVRVCQAAGARYVVAFPSSYGLSPSDFTNDHGFCALYVADSAFASTAALINACRVALEACRVLGADLWVGGIAQVPLEVGAVLNLVDDPGKLDVVPIQRSALQALLAALGPSDAGYALKRLALSASLARSSPGIQHAAIPYQWSATTAYGVGDLVVPSPENGRVFQCTLGGTSGGSQPAFATAIGAETIDGSVAWVATNYPSTLGLFAGGVRINADTSISPDTFPSVLQRYTLSPRDVSFTLAPPI